MYRYEVIKTDNAMSAPYGLIGKEEQDGCWRAVAVVAPFSRNQEAVAELAEKCTALQLCPWQLMDAVFDFVSGVGQPM